MKKRMIPSLTALRNRDAIYGIPRTWTVTSGFVFSFRLGPEPCRNLCEVAPTKPVSLLCFRGWFCLARKSLKMGGEESLWDMSELFRNVLWDMDTIALFELD